MQAINADLILTPGHCCYGERIYHVLKDGKSVVVDGNERPNLGALLEHRSVKNNGYKSTTNVNNIKGKSPENADYGAFLVYEST